MTSSLSDSKEATTLGEVAKLRAGRGACKLTVPVREDGMKLGEKLACVIVPHGLVVSGDLEDSTDF